MKKILFLCIISLFFITGCLNDNNSENNDAQELDYTEVDLKATQLESSIVDTSSKFAIKFFNKMEEYYNNREIFISPLSLNIALSMTYNGASNETMVNMKNVLEINEDSREVYNERISDLIQTLQNVDSQVKLKLANSLWIKEDYDVKQDFIDRNEKYFFSEVNKVDFTDSNTGNLIKDWVSEKTENLINDLNVGIDEDTRLLLINAIYFYGEWSVAFKEENTNLDTFYLSDGSTKEVLMMNGEKEGKYYETDYMSSIRLPYGRDKLAMYLFMPDYDNGYDLDDFFQNFTYDNWRNWMSSYENTYLTVKLPKFKYNFEWKEVVKNQGCLEPALQDLGMIKAFTHNADFSDIHETYIGTQFNLRINEVVHKSFVDVSEKGTEAAAVTLVSMGGVTSSLIINKIIKFDHPFFFVIRDDRTGTILFMGKVLNPEY